MNVTFAQWVGALCCSLHALPHSCLRCKSCKGLAINGDLRLVLRAEKRTHHGIQRLILGIVG